MFEHSVKVPRHYKIAANIFKKVSSEGGSVKTLLYDDKLKHFRTNVLYALITETIKHAADIDKIFENCSLLEKESRLDPWLAKVLTAELLFGKKSLPGKSKPEQTVLSYKEQFEKYASDHQGELKTQVVRRPRYVRINTNLLTTSDAIRAFQDEGYRFIRCTSGSYDDYLKQIQQLTEYDFTQDYHVKTVFVFSSGTKLHEHELYLEHKIILQDKATAIAVHLLAPPPGSVALDMCAAPGMKTTQLAAYMRNQGRIYAVERNEKRYHTLCDFVEQTGSKCVQTLHRDSLDIKRGELEDVEYILLDPSCSGSGMELCVHNYIEETRLAKLTSLQEKFLKHAMNAFPNAKRIVYSTCSLFPEENERVITNVVKTSRSKWRVQDVKELLKGQWNNVGSGMYGSMGTRCMYANPDTDLTTGFFLAVLDRDVKQLENSKLGETHRSGEESIENDDVNSSHKSGSKNNDNEIIDDTNEARHKKKKKSNNDKDISSGFEELNITETNSVQSSKKLKRNKNVDQKENLQVANNEENEDIPKKKKKKKHKSEDENEEEESIAEESSIPKDKVKKRKKHKDSVADHGANVENEIVDQPIQKKKKKSKYEEPQECTLQKSEQEIEDVIAKKKKKKKRDNIQLED